MLAEYGVWDYTRHGPPDKLTDWLLDAYIRRKRWEWQQQSVAIVNALGEALSDKPKSNPKADPFTQLSALGVSVPKPPSNPSPHMGGG